MKQRRTVLRRAPCGELRIAYERTLCIGSKEQQTKDPYVKSAQCPCELLSQSTKDKTRGSHAEIVDSRWQGWTDGRTDRRTGRHGHTIFLSHLNKTVVKMAQRWDISVKGWSPREVQHCLFITVPLALGPFIFDCYHEVLLYRKLNSNKKKA